MFTYVQGRSVSETVWIVGLGYKEERLKVRKKIMEAGTKGNHSFVA